MWARISALSLSLGVRLKKEMGTVFILAAAFFCWKQSRPKTQYDIQFPICLFNTIYFCMGWAFAECFCVAL